MSNENKEKTVDRMATVHHGQVVSKETISVHFCEARKTNGRLVGSCVQRSTKIVGMRRVKGKDRIQAGWTS